MSDAASIFSRIVEGTIPCHKVLETDVLLAFLDIAPVAPGHTLLITKHPYRTLDEVPPDVAAELGRTLVLLVAGVRAATGAAGANVLQNNGSCAGQVVEHVHFHIIPRCADDGLGYRWRAGQYPPGEAEAFREKIAARLA